MPENRKIAVIVNPCSAGGKTARRWPEIARMLEHRLGPLSVRFTESSGTAAAIARHLLQEGFDFIVAAGGDGTINEVANGFLENDQEVRPESRLGILPLATGGDFRRSLGIGPGIPAAVETLASGAPLLMDVGKATFVAKDEAKQSRYFVNVASFGIGGEVAARTQNAATPLGGTASFLWATFRTLFGYGGKKVRLELDGEKMTGEFFITNVAVGNGQFHGAGMHPCPQAVLDDGLFEVTVIDYLGIFEMARGIRILYSDDVYRHPKVHHFRARRVVAETAESAALELDGEPLGCLPFEATLLPRKLQVMVPAGSPLLGRPSM